MAVLCDWGEHYLTKLYDEEWMRSNGFLPQVRRTVEDVLRTKDAPEAPLRSVAPSTPVRMALSTLTSHDISQLPVMLDGECVGSVVEGDVMGAVLEDPALLDATVEELMGAPFPVVDMGLPADQLTQFLTRSNAAVLVRREGKVAGIVTRYDLIRTLTGAA